MEYLPQCEISVNMALYIHYYVEWDEQIQKYISKYNAQVRSNKISYIYSMIDTDISYLKGSVGELQWLYIVENDKEVQRIIKKCMNKLQE